MPEAAWCSACQNYVWVSPDGGCQFGHDSSCLTARYVSERHDTGPETAATSAAPAAEMVPDSPSATDTAGAGRVLLVLAVLAGVAVIGGSVLAAWLGVNAYNRTQALAARRLLTDSQQSYTNTHINSGSLDGEEPADRTVLAPSPISAMTESQWMSYVAQQYPGYRIEQRLEIPDQHGTGMLGMNYVLVNDKQPRFELLVGLAQVREQTSIDELPVAYLDAVDGIATTDALFSVNARSEASGITSGAQDAIIGSYADVRPKKQALVTGGFVDEGGATFTVVTGPKALERATKNPEDIDYYADAPMPTSANGYKTQLKLEHY